MKPWVTLLLLISFAACKKDTAPASHEAIILGKKWLTVQRLKNGIPDSTFTNEISVFEFRSDGKMYLTKEAPFVLADTTNYRFIDNDNIHLTKPWVSYTVDINCKIKLLDATHFDFTLTSPVYNDTYDYKTVPR